MLGKRLKIVKPNFSVLLGLACLDLLFLFFFYALLFKIIPIFFQSGIVLSNLFYPILNAIAFTAAITLFTFRMEKVRYKVTFYENGFVFLGHTYIFESLGKLTWVTIQYKHCRILPLPFRYSSMRCERMDVKLNTLYQKDIYHVFHNLYVENKQYKSETKVINH